MTLVIAGNNRISIEEAEKIKRDPARDRENFIICRPVIQRMANITANVLRKHPTEPIYVVGGASYLSEFEKEFSNYLNQTVFKPKYPQFVTPIGIAMSSSPIVD
jgi:ethanolamine utilization protein EutJ